MTTKSILLIALIFLGVPIKSDSSRAQVTTVTKPDTSETDYQLEKTNDSLKVEIRVRLKLDSLINARDTIPK